MSEQLGERELDVMGVLWKDGPGTAAEVQARLAAELAYNTVSTILRNLEVKRFVGHSAEGRLFTYFPLVTEQAARGTALSRIVDKLFRGSPLRVVSHLVENDTLSREELQALHQLLERQLAESNHKDDRTEPPSRRPNRARSGQQ